MKKLLSLITVYLLMGYSLQAQKSYRTVRFANHTITQAQMLNSDVVKVKDKLVNLSDIDGSPYWNKDFVLGKIYLKGQDKPLKVYLRYRIFNDKFEIKKQLTDSKSKIVALKRLPNITVSLKDKKFVFLQNLPIKVKGSHQGYAVELVAAKEDKDAALYKRMTQYFTPAKPARGRFSAGSPARLGREDYYFIKINDKIYLIEAHKRRAPKVFPNHNKALKDFVKEENLKFRGNDKQEDMIRLVKYYNTLN